MKPGRMLCLCTSLIMLLAACRPSPSPGPVIVATWTPAPPNAPAVDRQPTGTATPGAINAAATSTLLPLPTNPPTNTPTPTPPPLPGVETLYGRGVIPEGAVVRLGLGHWNVWETSPDGLLLALGTDVGVYVFDARTMQQLWTQPTVRPVIDIAWSPRSRLMATRLFEWGNVVIWDGQTGALLRRLENGSEVQSMAWSPGGTYMVVGLGSTSLDDPYDSIDGVAVWNVTAQDRLWLFQSAEPDSGLPPVGGVDWSPRGDLVAAALYGGEYALFEALSGARVGTLPGPRSAAHGFTEKLIFSPDGARLVSLNGIYGGDVPGGSYSAYVFDVATQTQVAELAHQDAVLDARWSPDSRRLIVRAGYYGAVSDIRVWDAPTGTLYFAAGDELNAASVRWSADGTRFISMHPHTAEILLWDAVTGERQSMGYEFPDLAAFAPLTYVALRADGSLIVWDAASGGPHYELRPTPPPAQVAWSPDQSQIALLDFSTRRQDQPSVSLWDVASAAPLGPEYLTDAWVPVADWTGVEPDGGCLIGEALQLVYDDSLSATFGVMRDDATRTSDTRILLAHRAASGEQSTIQIDEPGLPPPCTAAFSPDGRTLALGRQPMTRGAWGIRVLSLDHGVVTVYDTASGERLHELRGHTGAVHDLAWSPDGALLASASWDGTVIVWRVGG